MNKVIEPKEIRRQILREAKKIGKPSDEILQNYAMERFLYRLAQSEVKDQFILKGGLLINAWNPGKFRATKDIDLLCKLKSQFLEHIPQTLAKVSALDCADGVSFLPETFLTKSIRTEADYPGVQLKFKGAIDRTVIHMRIDVAFADAIFPNPLLFEFPTILEMPAPKLFGYTPESVIAEKVDAMLLMGSLNSRMKDFYDVWFLSRKISFKFEILRQAFFETFTRRKTPVSKEPIIFQRLFKENLEKREQWKNYMSHTFFEEPPGFSELMNDLERFLLPILESLYESRKMNGIWSLEKKSWS